MGVDDSMKRHPAGKKPVWDLAWALATAERKGVEQERERIIKLLEDNYKTDGAYLVTIEDDKPVKLNEAIALIKGENK